MADILLPEMASLSCDLVERAFATGLVKSNTLDLLLVDTPVSYAFYAVPADDDLIVLIVRDVTRERRSLVALRASEQRYRGLIESQQDLIVRVDGEGRFTFVNDAYCQKFGKTHQELIGATFYAVGPRGRSPRYAQSDGNARGASLPRLC